MKEITETLGATITEIAGLAGVVSGVYGAIVLLRAFGDAFIGYFIQLVML